MILILMGGPGAGKGSAAELLREKYNLVHVSTGDMFRDNIKKQTVLGVEAKKYIDKGNLVPDELTCQMVEDRLSKQDCKTKGFLLDGFPRNVYQAEQLDKIFERLGYKVTKVLNIVSDDDVILERLGGRRVCHKCGTTYHIVRKQPKVEGICDYDQEALVQRDDDNENTIKERLAIYHSYAEPLEKYYKNQNLIVNINGNGTIKESTAEIYATLENN